MSTLSAKDTTLLAPRALVKLQGLGQSFDHGQATAASLAGASLGTVKKPGMITEFAVSIKTVPAAGESMVYTLLVNGTTVATFTANANTVQANKEWPAGVSSFSGVRDVKVGDVLTVTRVYTAGGAPSPIGFNNVHVEIGDGDYLEALDVRRLAVSNRQ